MQHLPVRLFVANIGAAAALKYRIKETKTIKAIVSRGGRPDLAMTVLDQVRAPTLLIVGGNDFDVIILNKQAYIALNCSKKLEILPGATHLLEEPGALENVTVLPCNWFLHYLT